MPPKARTSKKRARSPAASKAAGAPEKTQTRSSKRAKKDAPDASAAAADEPKAQEKAVEAAKTAPAPAKTKSTKAKTSEDPAPPSFSGNFDLYTMSLPFLNSVFSPSRGRDYAALLRTIRTYQAKPDSSAQIFLPPAPAAEDPSNSGSGSADGRFRSSAVEDPLEGMPFDVALESPALADSIAFGAGAREDASSPDAFYSPSSNSSSSDARGVTASVALEDSHCGVSSTKGAFKMRRAWASADGDGKDEVFEGFFKIAVVYSGLYWRKCGEDGLDVGFAFRAIRAHVGADGEEIGIGAGPGGE